MPLWFISLLIPRKKNIIVFGSWFGERYSDNPMYIYEYASEKTELIGRSFGFGRVFFSENFHTRILIVGHP